VAVPVVIDGYNLLFATGATPSAASRAALVTRLVQWARAHDRRVTLVFDAGRGGAASAREEAQGPVTVVYTRAGETADALVVRRIAAHPEAVVVTSDRAVQQAVRRRGAAVMDAETFADRLDPDAEELEAPPAPARGRTRGRRAAWLRGL
jgi:predicted RNA-binding protein with PIN domain